MTVEIHEQARVLLELGAPEIRKQARGYEVYQRAVTEVGTGAAAWAFADNRITDNDAQVAVEGWPEPACHTLTLSGPNGRGKTVAAARWIGRHGGMFLCATELEREGWTGGELARKARSARRLVIDNLGSDTGRARHHTTALIVERHDAGLLTLITTTLIYMFDTKPFERPGAVAHDYPGSIASRLPVGWRKVGGPDLRCEDATPVLDGVARAAEIAGLARRVKYAADRLCPEDEGRAAVAGLADVLGVDLEGDAVRAAVDDLRRRRADALATLEDVAGQFQARAVALADARGAA